MRDEIEGRIWASHHDQFSADIHALLTGIGRSARLVFERIHAIQFAAPWQSQRRSAH